MKDEATEAGNMDLWYTGPVVLGIPLLTHVTAFLTPFHPQLLVTAAVPRLALLGQENQYCYWISKLGYTGRGKTGALENQKAVYIPSLVEQCEILEG